MVLVADLPELLREQAAWLSREQAPDEALAIAASRRRILGIGGGAVLKPVGRVWRLGVVLLDRESRLYATGAVTRAAEQRQHGYTSTSAAERSAVRALAADSFRPGEVVNYDAELLSVVPDGGGVLGPLRVESDGLVVVQWTRNGSYVDFGDYLKERSRLLVGETDV